MDLSSGELQKLKILSYSDGKFSDENADSFVAMVNPSSIKNSLGISYTDTASKESPTYESVEKEELSFDIILDGTGIIPQPTENKGKSVKDMVETLKKVTHQYDGDTHETPYVKIEWGGFETFKGRLSSMSIEYSMFKPGGDPLRAKVSLSFTLYKSLEVASADKSENSPDMTHIIAIKHGDSLPLLCQKIYGSSQYYLQIARINKLSSFRDLEVGTELIFPALN